jgi:hypothetical protein
MMATFIVNVNMESFALVFADTVFCRVRKAQLYVNRET